MGRHPIYPTVQERKGMRGGYASNTEQTSTNAGSGVRVVDLRSDTVTHPSPEMRQAMFDAELGDDVFGDDPTVNKLEAMAAELLGKQDATFVASGTMGNIATGMAHCTRGDEMLVGDKSHMFNAEAGAHSALGGIAVQTVRNDERGMMDPDEVRAAIRPDNIHYPPTTLIAMENTHNQAGGTPLTAEEVSSVAAVAKDHGIKFHIDGARLFNAAVALETPAAELVKDADTVSFCLSKGLSCPVGSVVVGSHQDIEKVRRWRKALGGGMRQVGVIAAAGVVALDTMIDRMAEDHANARKMSVGLAGIDGIDCDPAANPTNLVFCHVSAKNPTEILAKLDERGVRALSLPAGWRFVTHYGINSDDIDHALDVVESTFKEYAAF
jgi:threonine aldolase